MSSISVLGDCTSQEISQSYEKVRTLGLCSWLSLVSKNCMLRNFEESIESIKESNYIKKILRFDLNRNGLSYLLEKKADYLLVDINDCRKFLIHIVTKDSSAYYTYNTFVPGVKELFLRHIAELGQATYKIISPLDIDFHIFSSAIEKVCKKILSVYSHDQIIMHKHVCVKQMSDGSVLKNYNDNKEFNNRMTFFLHSCYNEFLKHIPECNIIDFPANVYGDSRHKFGAMPLHYIDEYNEYGKSALDIITKVHDAELRKILLHKNATLFGLIFKVSKNQLERNSSDLLISKKFELLRYNSPEYLKNINDIYIYIDYLIKIKSQVIILIAVKDTPGSLPFSSSFDLLGIHIDNKLWHTHVSCIYNDLILADISSEKPEIPSLFRAYINNLDVNLESHSFRKENRAVISINNFDYSANIRGVNIVVYDIKNKVVIDSIGFDSYGKQHVFFRKAIPQENNK